MRVVIAPDSFGGTLTARQAGAAMTDGWLRARPDDEVVTMALSDGGEGLLDVLVDGEIHQSEVAGPLTTPVTARWRLLDDGTALLESAQACGLALVPEDQRDPSRATTYGVGQLLEAARQQGASRIVVGLGGSATVDGGVGALTALGLRPLREDGNGLKVGGRHLTELATTERGSLDAAWKDLPVELWSDVTTPLSRAAEVFAPQKGALPDEIPGLARGLRRWADVAERDLGADPSLREAPGTGAAGGLAYGLAVGLGGELVSGAARVADLVELSARLEGAEAIVTGEGRLDATTGEGKVLDEVRKRAEEAGARVYVVVGRGDDAPSWISDLERSAPGGPGDDPAAEVAAAAERLAERVAGRGS
ncbi:MAG: glycerate kinase [Actinobacteria bacterium]|nr:glycerate kinase [Actinomycetota bacterium]